MATITRPLALKNKLGVRIRAAKLEAKTKLAKQQRKEEKEVIKVIRDKILAGHSERLEALYQPIIEINKDLKIFAESIKEGANYDRNIAKVVKYRTWKRKLQRKLIEASITKQTEKSGPRINKTNSGTEGQ